MRCPTVCLAVVALLAMHPAHAEEGRIPIFEPVTLDGETKVISGVDTPSPGADEAYIRIVVEDGTVTVSEPSVAETVAEVTE